MMNRQQKAQLESVFQGFNNANLEASRARVIRGHTYADLSTVWITPTRGYIPATIVSSWTALQRPMNQKFCGPIFMEGMEVGDAYNQAVEFILGHPEISKWKYLLTIEEDNAPPPNGLMLLYESITKYEVVSGLYWTKGEGGQPMCYGSPAEVPRNYVPQPPPLDCVKEYNGIGQGFALYRLEIFKKIPKPWFKTVQSMEEGLGTQDLFFCRKLSEAGMRVAVDGRCRVGHWDQDNKKMW